MYRILYYSFTFGTTLTLALFEIVRILSIRVRERSPKHADATLAQSVILDWQDNTEPNTRLKEERSDAILDVEKC